jgi:hypothetical protein
LYSSFALGETAFANDHTVRDADQFHFGEHHPRTLVAVVEQNVDAGAASVRRRGHRPPPALASLLA